MHNVAADIKALCQAQFGADFHLEILNFKTKTQDPYEKKTKNRFELRNALYRFLKEQKNFIFEEALDLRTVPQKINIDRVDYFSSFSHTDDIGIFVFDSNPIGVDFENCEKIQKAIVERVSSNSELLLHSRFQFLWSIKEAAFKAIPFLVQPKTISEIVVQKIESATLPSVKDLEISLFTSSAKGSPMISIQGLILSNGSIQLAVAKAQIK